MLQQPTVNIANLTALADHLQDNVTDNDFDMKSYCSCIAGHALRLFHGDATGLGAFSFSADDLGLDAEGAQALFCPKMLIRSRSEAVKVLRNAAVTGRIDWDA